MRRRKKQNETDGDLQKVDEHDTRRAGVDISQTGSAEPVGRGKIGSPIARGVWQVVCIGALRSRPPSVSAGRPIPQSRAYSFRSACVTSAFLCSILTPNPLQARAEDHHGAHGRRGWSVLWPAQDADHHRRLGAGLRDLCAVLPQGEYASVPSVPFDLTAEDLLGSDSSYPCGPM